MCIIHGLSMYYQVPQYRMNNPFIGDNGILLIALFEELIKYFVACSHKVETSAASADSGAVVHLGHWIFAFGFSSWNLVGPNASTLVEQNGFQPFDLSTWVFKLWANFNRITGQCKHLMRHNSVAVGVEFLRIFGVQLV